jgi:hypothetical protein
MLAGCCGSGCWAWPLLDPPCGSRRRQAVHTTTHARPTGTNRPRDQRAERARPRAESDVTSAARTSPAGCGREPASERPAIDRKQRSRQRRKSVPLRTVSVSVVLPTAPLFPWAKRERRIAASSRASVTQNSRPTVRWSVLGETLAELCGTSSATPPAAVRLWIVGGRYGHVFGVVG